MRSLQSIKRVKHETLLIYYKIIRINYFVDINFKNRVCLSIVKHTLFFLNN